MHKSPAQSRRNKIVSWIINLAGILILALILYLGGIEAWQQILAADWRFLIAGLLVTLLWNLVAAYRWSLIAEQVVKAPEPCPLRYYFTYHMMGILTGQVVPITVGMLGGRPVALSLSREVSLRRAGLSVFLDKLFDLTLALLLVGPVVLFLVGGVRLTMALGLMALMVALGGALLAWRYEEGTRLVGSMASRLAGPLVHLPVVGPRLISRLPQQMERLTKETLLSNRAALRVYLLTLGLYGLLAMRLYFVAQALRLEIPWHLLFMGVCVTQLALVFSVTPGSLGFLEGGWAAVLTPAGLSLEQFTLFVIARRAYVLVFSLIGTLLAFVWIRESPARLFRSVLSASRRPAEEQAQDPTRSSRLDGKR